MMQLHSLAATVVAVCVLGISAAQAQFPSGKPAPAFTLKKLDGKPLSLASLKGKVVFLDFWGPN
jgi:hypothetical protein